MAGSSNTETCGNGGCTLSKGHGGSCNGWEPCTTTGCSLRKGHGGNCNAAE